MVKAKRKADGEIIDVSSVEYTNVETNVKSRYCSKDGKKYPLSDLDFLPEKETAVLEGWVARDKGKGRNLHLFTSEPKRSLCLGEWSGSRGKSLLLDSGLFPSVKWQSEPMKVKIRIEEIE